MIMYRCFIQENQLSDAQRQALEAILVETAQALFPDSSETVPIKWQSVAEGFGFTAGAPSRASVVVTAIPDETPQETRVLFMKSICDSWSEVTGCSANDVVATALNLSLAVQAQA